LEKVMWMMVGCVGVKKMGLLGRVLWWGKKIFM